jgi:m7GpppX diphosphatase
VGLTFGVAPTSLRLYVHYLPSFYHLHVHIVHMNHIPPEDGVHIGHAILLDDIIDNLEIQSDWYQKVSLSVILGMRHPLYKLLTSSRT